MLQRGPSLTALPLHTLPGTARALLSHQRLAVQKEDEHGKGEEHDAGQQQSQHGRGVHVGRIQDVIARQQLMVGQHEGTVRWWTRLLHDNLSVLNLELSAEE